MIKDKISVLINTIANSDAPYSKEDIEAVERFISDCGNYIEKVTAMEASLQVARFHLEAEEYRELIVRLDRNRKYAHDALIASTRLMSRLCSLYDVEQIYTGPDERIPMGDFALEVTKAYFEDRKL